MSVPVPKLGELAADAGDHAADFASTYVVAADGQLLRSENVASRVAFRSSLPSCRGGAQPPT